MSKSFYSVQKGSSPGVFLSWEECQTSIHGFPGAVYKKFKTRAEAEAFVALGAVQPQMPVSTPPTPNYYVYTDGACSNNGSKHAKAGIGVWFGEADGRNVSQAITGSKVSNNIAELHAILRALELIESDLRAGKHVCVVTDSKYAILCLTTYGEKCAAANWTREIPNKDLVRTLFETFQRLKTISPSLTLLHVDAHTGKTDAHSVGNAGADRLANEAIGLTECPYSKGAIERVYLSVPFAQKEIAKSLGARWDSEKKLWYSDSDSNNMSELLSRFQSSSLK